LRTQQHLEFKHYWQVLQPYLCKSFKDFFLASSSPRLDDKYFIDANLAVILLFINKDDLEHVRHAVVNDKRPETPKLMRVLSTSLGQALFKAQGVQLRWVMFTEEVHKRLADLENLDFVEEEIASFQKVMTREVSQFVGDEEDAKKRTKFTKHEVVTTLFCNPITKKDIVNLNNCWNYPLHCKLVTLAVSNNNVPRLPHEVALFGDRDHLPGVRETVPLPESVLGPLKNVRRACLDLLQPVVKKSLADWIATIVNNEGYLCGLCKTFSIEIDWLRDDVTPLLKARCESLIEDAFPNAIAMGSFKETWTKLTQLKEHRAFLAGCDGTAGMLRGVTDLVHCLEAGHGPIRRLLDNFSEFYKKLLKRCDHLMTSSIQDQKPGGKLCFAPPEVVYGRRAIELKLQDMERRIKSASKVEPKEALRECKWLRTFSWLLDEAETTNVNTWITSLVDQAKSLSLGLKSLKDGGEEDLDDGGVGGQLVPRDGLVSASASSSSAAPFAATTVSKSAAKIRADSIQEAHNDRVASFFKARKPRSSIG
jgi:hypothetical protein